MRHRQTEECVREGLKMVQALGRVTAVLRRIWRSLNRQVLEAKVSRELPASGTINYDSPPIFVIGVQRSGTSLLRRMLDTHPNIACPPESKFILPLQELIKDDQALRGLASMGFPRQVVMKRLREFVAEFFEAYAAAKGKSRWADKTPNYVDCLDFLDELFAFTPRYIAIVRHPFDVCLSFEQAAKNSGKPMRAIRSYVAKAPDFRIGACRFWNDQNLKIASFLPQVLDRAVAISYEALTSKPDEVLPRLIGFLDEPWDPVVLGFNAVHHDHGFEDRKIRTMPTIVSNSGKFLGWPLSERQRLAEVAEECMTTFGYESDRVARGSATQPFEAIFLEV